MVSHVSDNHDFLSPNCMWVNGPIIVGAGPSGLSVASMAFPMLFERSNLIASLRQKRTYDRLKLHLPKQFCQLPGLPFPDFFPEYPCRRQFIDCLESYAKHFEINPRLNRTVLSARYEETTGLRRVRTTLETNRNEVEYIGRRLVVATRENAEAVVPKIKGLDEFTKGITHVCDYKTGEDYRGKQVLVVGCGNSGMEVCLDLCDYGASPIMVVRGLGE